MGLFAQQLTRRDTIVQTDTINLRGVVYGYDGNPVKNIEIDLWSRSIYTPAYSTRSKTDINGCFEFKGANPDDWLTFTDGQYGHVHFFSKGSRFMVIYLPQPKVISVNKNDSIIVKSPRKYPRAKPSIKLQLPETGGFPDLDLIYPGPKDNREKFINYIKQNLVYPEKAIGNNIEGEVEIAFTVEKNASLTNFKILKGIGYGCDEEVIELMKKIKFRPGIYLGRIFSIQETIAVEFKLTDN